MSACYWTADSAVSECEACFRPFTTFLNRRHHCRDCGGVFCSNCTSQKVAMPHRGYPKSQVRVCKYCFKYIDAKISRRAVTAAPIQNNQQSITSAETYSTCPPDDTTATEQLLSQVQKDYRGRFLAANDLFVKNPHSGEVDFTSQTTAKVEPTKLEVQLPPPEFKEHIYPFPAHASTNVEHAVAILLDAKPHALLDSYVRLRGSLTMAHKLAVETVPQATMEIVRVPQYY